MDEYKKAIPTAFTSYGLWEDIRLILVKELLTESLINEKVTRAHIENSLLGAVMTDLLDEFLSINEALTEGWMSPQPLLTQRALEIFLPSLSKSLKIPEYLLQPHVDKFLTAYKKIVRNELRIFNDKLLTIGPEILEDAIASLYGADFNEKYPGLALKICESDPDLQQLVTKLLGNKIEQDMPKNPRTVKRWKQQVIYMNECAAQKEYSFGFSEPLKKEIRNVLGKSLEEYKQDVANKNKKDIYCNLGVFPSPILENKKSKHNSNLESNFSTLKH